MYKVFYSPFTVIYYTLFFLTLLFFHPIQFLSHRIFGYAAHKLSVDWMSFFLMRCLNVLGTRFAFSNPFEWPEEGPLIIVSNHQSTYDIPPIIWYFRRYHPKFISKHSLGKGIPSVSYNLRHGGSVLIDRNQPIKAIGQIREFARRIEKNKWTAVIFPEGTRTKDGNPNRFRTKGLITLLEEIPNARVVALSINNSWRLAQYHYFPMPLGVKINFKVEGVFPLADHAPKALAEKIEHLIKMGVEKV